MDSILLFLHKPIQKAWPFWLYASVLVYLTFPYLRLFEAPGIGLDPSWQIALGLLREHSGTWGKDIVFTYGPLGSYIYRLPIHVSMWKQLLYDAFFFANLLYFHATCFPKQAKIYHIMLFFAFNLFSFEMIGETTTFLWMFLGMYHGFVALYAKSKWKQGISLVLAFILLGIIFFTKVNFGLVVWVFLIALLLVLVLEKRMLWWEGLMYVGIFLFSLVVWADYLHTDILMYVESSFHIIAFYNSGMSVFPVGFRKLTALTYGLFVLLLMASFYFVIGTEKQRLREYFLLATGLGIAFILLKYSFVRADSGHFTAYIKLMTYVCLLLYSFSAQRLIKQIFVGLMPTLFVFYLLVYAPSIGFTPLGIWHGIKYRPFILKNYLEGTLEIPTNKSQLPNTFIKQIKHETVDVIPYQISWVHSNDLNYSPRPTLQSYVAGDRYLDSLNEAFFASEKAPQFVIYSLEKSSQKYPWSEELLTQKALFKHYSLTDSNDTLLLFKRQAKARKLRLVYTRQSRHRIGEEIQLGELQSGYLRESSFETAYSSLGNLANLFFQPPQLMADFKSYQSHEKVSIAPNLLKKGFWSNNLILNLAQAKRFYTVEPDASNRLQSIKISEAHFFKGGFKPEILVRHRYYRIE